MARAAGAPRWRRGAARSAKVSLTGSAAAGSRWHRVAGDEADRSCVDMIIGPDAMGLLGLAGYSALLAAVATVLGAVLLALFFTKGQPWGTLNDIASIVLMLVTLPVVAFFASFARPYLVPGVALRVAVLGA